MQGLVGTLCFLVIFAVTTWWRMRQRLATLEDSMRRLRTLALRMTSYRRLTPEDREANGMLEAATAQTEQIRALGWTLLGDMIEVEARGPTRWFVDREGTTFGWVGVAPRPGGGLLVVACLMSVSDERAVFTLCSPRPTPGLAQPPFIDRAVIVGPLRLVEAYAAHGKRVPEGARRVTTLDEAVELFQDSRKRNIAWRESQLGAELLDRDLRAVLGRHYDRLGPEMAKRLAVELPVARVHV